MLLFTNNSNMYTPIQVIINSYSLNVVFVL